MLFHFNAQGLASGASSCTVDHFFPPSEPFMDLLDLLKDLATAGVLPAAGGAWLVPPLLTLPGAWPGTGTGAGSLCLWPCSSPA